MRAARFVGPGRMVCEHAPLRPPAEGEVLVRTHTAAICGSDLHVVFAGVGIAPRRHPGYPGHEGIGRVALSRSPLHQVGDLVLTCPAGPDACCFAEYQTLSGIDCIPVPAFDGPLDHLVMAQQLGTVIFALRQHPVDVVGKTVMVMGQGSAGVFFAWLLRRAGAAQVLVSDRSASRLASARQMGATLALDADDHARVRQALLDHTGGQGADLVVEAVGSREAVLQAVDLARPGANLLYFGLPDTTAPVLWNFHDFFRKKLKVGSVFGTQREEGRVSFRLALELIASGQIDVGPMISHRLPLEEIDRAMQLANDRDEGARKVLLSIQDRV